MTVDRGIHEHLTRDASGKDPGVFRRDDDFKEVGLETDP
jgi:hypothetical protein